MDQKNSVLLYGGGIVGVILAILARNFGWEMRESVVLATVFTMAVWWISECLPIYVTALVPLVVFPLADVVPMKELAPKYMQDIIFLFIGGFIVAYAIERCGLHKRIALKIILLSGNSMPKILLGFMLASYLLSMWILNTATVTMLIPAVLAVLFQLGKHAKKLSSPMLLGIAYASSIGGMATLVGTLPNMIVKDAYSNAFSDLPVLTFASWMKIGLPISIVLFAVTYLLLRFKYLSKLDQKHIELTDCKTEYKALGPLSGSEKWLIGIFFAMALSWLTIKPIEVGDWQLFGWSSLFPNPSAIKESTVAMVFAMLLYLVPRPTGKALAVWDDIKRLPIGIIFLFGAGYALVEGFTRSGLSMRIQESLSFAQDTEPFLIVLSICLVITFLTELTSNTTSINLFIPILIPLAMNMQSAPLELIMPVTFCASCAFMLPVATPPNTIVFGSERLPLREMIRTGLILNLISVIVISALSFLLI